MLPNTIQACYSGFDCLKLFLGAEGNPWCQNEAEASLFHITWSPHLNMFYK